MMNFNPHSGQSSAFVAQAGQALKLMRDHVEPAQWLMNDDTQEALRDLPEFSLAEWSSEKIGSIFGIPIEIDNNNLPFGKIILIGKDGATRLTLWLDGEPR